MVWPPMSCPPVDKVSSFVMGALPVDEAALLEAHVDQCPACEERLVQVARQRHALLNQPGGDLLGRGAAVGRFLVLELLGAGAMGSVYAAYDPTLDRQVALKVLDAWAASESERLELSLREARVLAQLNHPNVVAVYDAALHEGVAWVAMERVNGPSLGQWLKTPRSTAQICRVFIEAGEGLSAAHQAGLVHRDFKPSNVLIGDDARVRVGDFGLAAGPLGEPGSLSGTWAYLAPELRAGGPANARSDQFAYCVAFAAALGAMPGAHGEALSLPMSVPWRVRHALQRGLSKAPEDRFESMQALLAAARIPPRRGWLSLGVGIGVAVGLLAVAASSRQVCHPQPEALAGVWDGPTRVMLQGALVDPRKPATGEAWARAEGGLDRWRTAWLAEAHQACLDASNGADSQRLVELRQTCLADRLDDVRAVTRALSGGGANVALKSPQLVESLGGPATCRDARALLEEMALPAEPARAKAVRTMQARLAEIKAMRDLGRLTAARDALEPMMKEAETLEYPPVTALVAFRLGTLLLRMNEPQRAVMLLERAVAEGLAGRSDTTAAQAATLLVFQVGSEQGEPRRAEAWAQLAGGLIRRKGGDASLSAGLLLNRCLVAESHGRLPEAMALCVDAVRDFEREGHANYGLGNALLNLGWLQLVTGHLQDAAHTLERGRSIIETTRGRRHPNLGVALRDLGAVRLEQGQLASALEALKEARAISEESLGATHLEVTEAEEGIVRVLLAGGQLEEAAAVAKASLARVPSSAAAQLAMAEVELRSGAAGRALQLVEALDVAKLERVRAARLLLLRARAYRATGDARAPGAAANAAQLAPQGTVLATQIAQVNGGR